MINKLAFIAHVLRPYPSELAILKKIVAAETPKSHHDKLKESSRWDISEPILDESGWGVREQSIHINQKV